MRAEISEAARTGLRPVDLILARWTGRAWEPLATHQSEASGRLALEAGLQEFGLVAIVKRPVREWPIIEGLSAVVWNGTPGSDLVEELRSIESASGTAVAAVFRYHAPSQTWEAYISGAPPATRIGLARLYPGDVIVVRGTGPGLWLLPAP